MSGSFFYTRQNYGNFKAGVKGLCLHAAIVLDDEGAEGAIGYLLEQNKQNKGQLVLGKESADDLFSPGIQTIGRRSGAKTRKEADLDAIREMLQEYKKLVDKFITQLGADNHKQDLKQMLENHSKDIEAFLKKNFAQSVLLTPEMKKDKFDAGFKLLQATMFSDELQRELEKIGLQQQQQQQPEPRTAPPLPPRPQTPTTGDNQVKPAAPPLPPRPQQQDDDKQQRGDPSKPVLKRWNPPRSEPIPPPAKTGKKWKRPPADPATDDTKGGAKRPPTQTVPSTQQPAPTQTVPSTQQPAPTHAAPPPQQPVPTVPMPQAPAADPKAAGKPSPPQVGKNPDGGEAKPTPKKLADDAYNFLNQPIEGEPKPVTVGKLTDDQLDPFRPKPGADLDKKTGPKKVTIPDGLENKLTSIFDRKKNQSDPTESESEPVLPPEVNASHSDPEISSKSNSSLSDKDEEDLVKCAAELRRLKAFRKQSSADSSLGIADSSLSFRDNYTTASPEKTIDYVLSKVDKLHEGSKKQSSITYAGDNRDKETLYSGIAAGETENMSDRLRGKISYTKGTTTVPDAIILDVAKDNKVSSEVPNTNTIIAMSRVESPADKKRLQLAGIETAVAAARKMGDDISVIKDPANPQRALDIAVDLLIYGRQVEFEPSTEQAIQKLISSSAMSPDDQRKWILIQNCQELHNNKSFKDAAILISEYMEKLKDSLEGNFEPEILKRAKNNLDTGNERRELSASSSDKSSSPSASFGVPQSSSVPDGKPTPSQSKENKPRAPGS